MDPRCIELIRERARGWVANGDTPSLVLLVARKGVIVLEEAFGILRPSDNAPLQTDSIFPIMSISKPITAAAVMYLVEDGLLSLKHPITDYVPEITAPGADQVLIADLLSHTSGYDDDVVLPHVKARLDARVPSPRRRRASTRTQIALSDSGATRPFRGPPAKRCPTSTSVTSCLATSSGASAAARFSNSSTRGSSIRSE